MEAQMAEVEVERAFLLHQQGRDHAGGDGLADDGGQSDACHAHGEEDDEHEVQHHIDGARHGQTEQRPLCVAHGGFSKKHYVIFLLFQYQYLHFRKSHLLQPTAFRHIYQ